MWVERVSDDYLIFHCSHPEAPEPKFEGWVVGMRIEPHRTPQSSVRQLVELRVADE
jgi:hypothetical protein